MRRLAILGSIAVLMAVMVPSTVLAARSGPGRCVGGTMLDKTYHGFIVTGACTIAYGANVHIKGDLWIAPGAKLDDHGAEKWMHAQLHVSGNIHVGKGAVLGLGWNSPQGEGSLGPDTVGGSIVANRPLAMQIGQVTIGGNLISNGGGLSSTSLADFRNFPIEDSVIHGNLIVHRWKGGWFGAIRNTVGGNAIFTGIVSRSNGDTGPGMDTDSTEIMGTHIVMNGVTIDVPQTIGGNLICYRNVPAAQVNPLDGGAANFVHGRALGECAGLTQ